MTFAIPSHGGGDALSALEALTIPPTLGTPDGDRMLGKSTKLDHLKGLGGNDTLIARGGADWLSGGNGNDLLTGNEAGNQILGGSGSDTASGGGGRDLIDGGKGDDRLNGGLGNDTLRGGTGDDTLAGGAGADTFQFRLGDGVDHITGFRSGVDEVQILLTNPGEVNIAFTYQGGDAVVRFLNVTVIIEDVAPNSLDFGPNGDFVLIQI